MKREHKNELLNNSTFLKAFRESGFFYFREGGFNEESNLGFYGGEVSPGFKDSLYIDLPVCSIFWGVDRPGAGGGGSDTWYFGIVQPIGRGY